MYEFQANQMYPLHFEPDHMVFKKFQRKMLYVKENPDEVLQNLPDRKHQVVLWRRFLKDVLSLTVRPVDPYLETNT